MSSSAKDHSPIAAGELATTPFGHLLLYIYRKASSGTLLISHGAREEVVLFHEGRVCAARLSEPHAELRVGLLPLCSLVHGSYAFYQEDLLQRQPADLKGAIDPYALLSLSIEDHVREDMVDAVLDHMGGGQLRIQPGRDLARLKLQACDAVLVDLIRAAPATIAELCEQSPLGARRTRRLLYLLVITHMIVPYADRKGGEIYKSHVRAPEFKPPTSAASLGPPDGAIGTDPPASCPPRSVPGTPSMPAWRRLASLRPSLPTGGAIAPAVSLRAAPAPPVSLRASADPKAKLQLIERCCERGEYDEALQLSSQYVEANDRDADAHAVHAYVLFKRHLNHPDGLPREVLEGVRYATGLDPENARALLTKGLVYKAAGDLRKAAACFQRACAADRHNLEAKRELRLARMRQA